MGVTDDPTDPRLRRGIDDEPVPQSEMYLVLSEAERARGFVRPVRETYVHFGNEVCGNPDCGHAKQRHVLTAEDFHGRCYFATLPGAPLCTCREFVPSDRGDGCGSVTSMGRALAETYAAKPEFYGATFCVHCQKHRPVAEFRWDGTAELVGS